MQKRRFVGATVVAAVAGLAHGRLAAAARPAAKTVPGPTLLTVSDAIGAGSRGAFEVRDA